MKGVGSRLARIAYQVLRSQAKPVGWSIQTRTEESSTRQSSFVHALIVAGLLDSNDDGAFSNWMHRFGEHDIGSHIDEQLGSEEGTYKGESRSTNKLSYERLSIYKDAHNGFSLIGADEEGNLIEELD